MTHMTKWGLVLGLCGCSMFMSAAAQAPASARPAASQANQTNGKAQFVKNGCSQCHGLEGQGAPTSGPRIGPNPLPLAAFVKYVRTPTGQMPPYSAKVLTDSDLGEIRTYLASRPGPAVQTLLPAE